MPPAASIISGTQWPPAKTGSSHSSAATRGAARRSGDALADGLDPRLELGPQPRRPRSGRPAAAPSRSASASTSPSVEGSSESTCGLARQPARRP